MKIEICESVAVALVSSRLICKAYFGLDGHEFLYFNVTFDETLKSPLKRRYEIDGALRVLDKKLTLSKESPHFCFECVKVVTTVSKISTSDWKRFGWTITGGKGHHKLVLPDSTELALFWEQSSFDNIFTDPRVVE